MLNSSDTYLIVSAYSSTASVSYNILIFYISGTGRAKVNILWTIIEW